MSKIKLSKNFIKNVVKLALNEDLYPSGDITSNLIQNNKIIKVKLISNQNAIIGGLLFANTYNKHRSLLLVSIEHGLYGNTLFFIGLGWYFWGGSLNY